MVRWTIGRGLQRMPQRQLDHYRLQRCACAHVVLHAGERVRRVGSCVVHTFDPTVFLSSVFDTGWRKSPLLELLTENLAGKRLRLSR